MVSDLRTLSISAIEKSTDMLALEQTRSVLRQQNFAGKRGTASYLGRKAKIEAINRRIELFTTTNFQASPSRLFVEGTKKRNIKT